MAGDPDPESAMERYADGEILGHHGRVDGWLLAVVWRARENRSDLAVFNAQDIEAGPTALVHLGHRVPDGFHGNWVGAN